MARAIISAFDQVAIWHEAMSPWNRIAAAMTVAPSSGGIVSGPGAAVGADKPVAGAIDPVRDPRNKLPAAGLTYDGMVDNLVSHYHGSTDDQKKQGRLWYRVAHNLFANHAKDAGVSHARAVAVGSATSPNTDWNENVKHAGNMLMNYRPNDPNHNEQDWQMAHIHPQARADFQAQHGRDPTGSDADLHQLADLHAPHFERGPSLSAQNDLSNPEARANWMSNIQHHGIDNVLADHEKQVFDGRLKKGGYQPAHAMRHIMRRDLGGTLGNNVKAAKAIIRSGIDDPDEFARILGGPKVRNFSSNILDPTPMDSEGYLQHPNGDWTQHADLGGTIDAHHLRASTMAHGQWERKGYRPEGEEGKAALNPSDAPTYDVFNRGLLDATHRINATISDPDKHLTPKQVQAVIWLKHKADNDRFKPMPINHESELTPEIQQAHDIKMQKKQEAEERKRQRERAKSAALEGRDFAEMPPLWRKMFLTRVSPEWTDLLKAWVDHHSPEPGRDDGSQPGLDPADPR
jgi:hypothetical protein